MSPVLVAPANDVSSYRRFEAAEATEDEEERRTAAQR